MDEIKRLMGFVIASHPNILITPCIFAQELEKRMKNFKMTCADIKCDDTKNCIKINPEAPFLPISKFDVWIVDMSKFRMSIGYVFYLARSTLKNNGILAITGKKDVDDSVALSYGMQILYHGTWHYYLRG